MWILPPLSKVVVKLHQACWLHQDASSLTNLMQFDINFADLLQFVETLWIKSVDNRLFIKPEQAHPDRVDECSGAGRTIIEGENIYIFVFTDCKNNRFQKKLIKQNAHI